MHDTQLYYHTTRLNRKNRWEWLTIRGMEMTGLTARILRSIHSHTIVAESLFVSLYTLEANEFLSPASVDRGYRER